MIDSYTKTPRPLRHVDVDYVIDQTKCAKCSDKPCLTSCPIDAIYIDEDDGFIKLRNIKCHRQQQSVLCLLLFTRQFFGINPLKDSQCTIRPLYNKGFYLHQCFPMLRVSVTSHQTECKNDD